MIMVKSVTDSPRYNTFTLQVSILKLLLFRRKTSFFATLRSKRGSYAFHDPLKAPHNFAMPALIRAGVPRL